MSNEVIVRKRNSFKRAAIIAEELGLGQAVVEEVLKREKRLYREELATYGSTTILGLTTITVKAGDNPEDVTVRGRVSATLTDYLIKERLKEVE